MGQLRKLINRAGANKVGKIEIANTYARFGIGEEQAQTLADDLGQQKINGFPLKPSLELSEDGRAGRYGSKTPGGKPASTSSLPKPKHTGRPF